MTCKDCIHYEACKSMCEAFGFTVDGDGEAASERCEQFEKALENSEFAGLVARLRLTNSRSKRALLDSAAYAIEYLQIQMNREHLAHLRLQDYDVSRAEDYRRMTIERNMLARKLREKESALELMKQGRPQWISVGDRMPDVDVFLGISRFNNRVRTYEVRKWDREWVVGGLNIKKDIKFWIPLPEPPKEG